MRLEIAELLALYSHLPHISKAIRYFVERKTLIFIAEGSNSVVSFFSKKNNIYLTLLIYACEEMYK